MDESLEETAARELEEETGIRGVELRQFKTFSQVNRDPRTRVVTTVYYGTVTDDHSEAVGGDDAETAAWFPVLELPSLGFDHREIIGLLLSQFKAVGSLPGTTLP